MFYPSPCFSIPCYVMRTHRMNMHGRPEVPSKLSKISLNHENSYSCIMSRENFFWHYNMLTQNKPPIRPGRKHN